MLLLGRPSGTAGSMAGRPAATGTKGLCSPEWLLKASEPGAPKAKPPVEARPEETVAIECTAAMAHDVILARACERKQEAGSRKLAARSWDILKSADLTQRGFWRIQRAQKQSSPDRLVSWLPRCRPK